MSANATVLRRSGRCPAGRAPLGGRTRRVVRPGPRRLRAARRAPAVPGVGAACDALRPPGCGLNQEFEHRLATGRPLDLAGLCAAPIVAARVAQWRRFAATHAAAPDVVEFLSGEDVADDYDRYVAVTTRAGFTADPDLQLESIRLDSGGYLARLVRLVGRFNGRHTAPDLLQQFHDLGVAAKLTDELTDIATDHAEGRYNLLLGLLGQEPGELAAVLSQLNGSLPMPVAWWQESAPLTFARFTALYGEYHGRLRSPDLQRACDATMLRALGGPRRQRRGPGRHVAEPPQEAWR